MDPSTSSDADAARRRVAVEMVARHERALRRTARRYSICAEDAEDAFQRALEILLLKAPPGDARDLVRWMQTVTKHEALAVRRGRERQLGGSRPEPGGSIDLVSLIPSSAAGPAERAERHEEIARSREALKTLKPAELRALTLLAQGYSYAEICELTGYSRTKVNRCLAEGRERFRAFLTRSESGGRCAELRPVLSAFCDGEAAPAQVSALREHLRACAHCRAALRAYRAAPGAAAALAPAPLLRPLLDRLHQCVAAIHSRATRLHLRLGGRRANADTAATQVAASGGARGAGAAGLAKLLAICAATAGGTAACVTGGVVPAALELGGGGTAAASRPAEPSPPPVVPPPGQTGEIGAGSAEAEQAPSAEDEVGKTPEAESPEAEPEVEPAPAGAVEYVPPPPPTAPSPPAPEGAAGEFGP